MKMYKPMKSNVLFIYANNSSASKCGSNLIKAKLVALVNYTSEYT